MPLLFMVLGNRQPSVGSIVVKRIGLDRSGRQLYVLQTYVCNAGVLPMGDCTAFGE